MSPGGVSPSTTPNGPPPNTDTIYQLADTDFKQRDSNGDGKLNADEMPASLKASLDKYDTNRDGLIDQTEYRAYFASRWTGMDQDATKPMSVTTIIVEEEEDWDRRTFVLRAGKLPKDGLPSWFKDLDSDNDGQIALYEWRKGSEPLSAFHEWDLDDDGFITAEEAMKVYAKKTGKTDPSQVAFGMSSSSSVEGIRPQFGKGQGGNKGQGNRGGGFAGFFGKGKKGQQPQQP